MNRKTGGSPFPNCVNSRPDRRRSLRPARRAGVEGWLGGLRLAVWAFLIVGPVWVPSQAQESRRESFRFLDMAASGRLAALGGNHAAMLTPDPGSALSNPAFLATTDGVGVGIQTGRLPAGITQAGAEWINPVGRRPGAEDRELRTLVAVRSVLYGEMDRLDAQGATEGTFRSFDSQWTAAAAMPLGGGWAAGASASVILSSYGGWNSSAYALTGGVSWTDADGTLTAGLAVRNLGGQFSAWDDVREALPLRIALGLAHKPQYFPARLHITAVENGWGRIDPDLLGGAEFLFSDSFHVRLGFHSGLHNELKTASRLDLAGVQGGIGLRIRDLRIDLSRTSWGRLGGILQVGVQGL